MKKLIWKTSFGKSEIRTEDNFLRYVVNRQPSIYYKRTLEDNIGNTLAKIGEKAFSVKNTVKFSVEGFGEGYVNYHMGNIGESLSYDMDFLGWEVQSMNVFSNMIVRGQDTIAYVKVKKGFLSSSTEITVYDESCEVPAIAAAMALTMINY